MNQIEYFQNIIEFQKVESEELNRDISIYEAIALWLNCTDNSNYPNEIKADLSSNTVNFN